MAAAAALGIPGVLRKFAKEHRLAALLPEEVRPFSILQQNRRVLCNRNYHR